MEPRRPIISMKGGHGLDPPPPPKKKIINKISSSLCLPSRKVRECIKWQALA